MKYIKAYESECIGIKIGDIVVAIEPNDPGIPTRLRYGEKYIINYIKTQIKHIYKYEVDNEKDYVTVKNINGDLICDEDNDPILYFARRFVPELEFKAMKYNL
jgi:hypothetical protein